MTYPLERVYPDIVSDIPGTIPFTYEANQLILSTQFASGKESRRLLWQGPRRNVSIRYNGMTLTQAQWFWEFYRSMDGPFQSFVFYFPRIRTYYDEVFGSSDGSEDLINLPCKDIQLGSGFELRRGNVVLIYGSDYTINIGAGAQGCDQADLDVPGEVGQNYFFSFTGRLKIKTRFNEKEQGFSEIKDMLSQVTVKLLGLQGELV